MVMGGLSALPFLNSRFSFAENIVNRYLSVAHFQLQVEPPLAHLELGFFHYPSKFPNYRSSFLRGKRLLASNL